ncbi:hypothetical protein [Nocardia sp. NPDC004604]|uniref:hypothetical protein n=1 Tax=Nocardia sp. NPDC004604 TaxID=3157013 RepID=UPI0033BAED2F
MRPKPTAIGYLRKDISGVSRDWDEIQIRSRAKRLGYDLAKTVTFSAETIDPEGRLVNVVQTLDVDAVIAPSLEHFGGQVPQQLVQQCELNTVNPQETYAPHAPFRFADVDGAEPPMKATTLEGR